MSARSDVAFVLVRPARPANVGAACRAMKNMGFSDLRLVSSRLDRTDPSVRAPAYGAWDVLDGAQEHRELSAAVADCVAVVGCSGREGSSTWSARELALRPAPPGRLALVFGPEASGLTNAELALCEAHVRIPSDAAQPSLNLAQAVLVLAYELRLARLPGPTAPPGDAASFGEVEAALRSLRDGLVGIGYLDAQNPDVILAELRRLLARARPTRREATLLRGLARQIEWAAARIAEWRAGRG